MARSDRDAEAERDGDVEIKVTDRRQFRLDGELRQALPETEEDEEETERATESAKAAPRGPERSASEARTEASKEETEAQEEAGFERRPIEEPEGVNFTMLIRAMAQPALIFLGEVAHPGTGKPETNLEQARLQIDLLDMLRIKCRGNVTAEEQGLLEQTLYQLRMLYVARSGEAT